MDLGRLESGSEPIIRAASTVFALRDSTIEYSGPCLTVPFSNFTLFTYPVSAKRFSLKPLK